MVTLSAQTGPDQLFCRQVIGLRCISIRRRIDLCRLTAAQGPAAQVPGQATQGATTGDPIGRGPAIRSLTAPGLADPGPAANGREILSVAARGSTTRGLTAPGPVAQGPAAKDLTAARPVRPGRTRKSPTTPDLVGRTPAIESLTVPGLATRIAHGPLACVIPPPTWVIPPLNRRIPGPSI